MTDAGSAADSDKDVAQRALEDLAVLDLPREQVASLFAFRHWILTSGRSIADTHAVVSSVGERFRETGMALDRMMTAVEVRHSERAAVGRIWEPGKPPSEFFMPHGSSSDEDYHTSPFSIAHETGEWVRFAPQDTDDGLFKVVAELKADGFTDYICAPGFGMNGMRLGFTFATRSSGGFSAADIIILRFLLPALFGLMDLLATRRVLQEVARIYLGAEPSERVLSGDIQRGEVMPIHAVILFADMRRFTETSMTLSTEETVRLLNHYYDCVVAAVEESGGEVLKFIGDGVLAIFRVDDGTEATAARSALTASEAALTAVEALNASGEAPAQFEIGIGLHLGEAAYGNVGSGERQDYTVVGKDVNLASRIAGLCGTLGKPLVLSKPCAARLGDDETVEIGGFPLKGVPGQTTVFTPSD